jgi:hypothetical protein
MRDQITSAPTPDAQIAGSITQVIGDLADLAARLPGLTERDAAIASHLGRELIEVAAAIRRLPDELIEPYRARWAIEVNPGGLKVWTATHRSGDGRHVRSLVAPSAAELAAKLAVADLVEP